MSNNSNHIQVSEGLTTADVLQEQTLENAVVLHRYMHRQSVTALEVNRQRLIEIDTELARCDIRERRLVLTAIRTQRVGFAGEDVSI